MPADVDLLKEAVDGGYTPLEYRACQIGFIYERLRREFFPDDYYNGLNIKRDKRKSTGFCHFYKLAQIESSHRDIIPDVSLYLRGQFEVTQWQSGHPDNFVPIPPQHLHTKVAMRKYRDYVIHLQQKETYTSSEKPRSHRGSIITPLGKTATLITKMNLDIFGTANVDWPAFMGYVKDGDWQPLFLLLVLQNLVSRYFLAASRSYPLWVKSLDPDVRHELPGNLADYKGLLLQNPKALHFGREVFGSEFSL